MPNVVKMLSRVPVFRRVATAHVPALEAQPQGNPGVPDLDALFTHVLRRLGDFDLIEMTTFGSHDYSL